MPFQSEAQRRYLWANEPEIARDWTETYGSKIQKANGGIMRAPFRVGNVVGREYDKAAEPRDLPRSGGGPDMATISGLTRPRNPTLVFDRAMEQIRLDETNKRIADNHNRRIHQSPKKIISRGINTILDNPFLRTYAAWGTGGISEKLRQILMAKKLYDTRNIIGDEAIEDEVINVPITGGIFPAEMSFNRTGIEQINPNVTNSYTFANDLAPEFQDSYGLNLWQR